MKYILFAVIVAACMLATVVSIGLAKYLHNIIPVIGA